MSNRESYALIGLLASYYLLHFMQRQVLGPEWLRYYGKDLIFIPVLLLSAKGAAALAGRSIHLGGKQIAAAAIYAIVVFEWMLPALSEKYVSDLIDIGAYVVGAAVYYAVSKAVLKIEESKEGR